MTSVSTLAERFAFALCSMLCACSVSADLDQYKSASSGGTTGASASTGWPSAGSTGGGTGSTAGAGVSGGASGSGTCDKTLCDGACVDLTVDPDHCGACGHGCCGGVCQAGACQPVELARDQASPFDIAVDGANVYWTNQGNGNVMKVAKTGGSPSALATGQGELQYLTLDGANVYFTSNNGSVGQVPKAGGGVITLATGQGGPTGISVLGSNVYWTNTGSMNVMRVPVGGGGASALCAWSWDQPVGVVAASSSLYVTTQCCSNGDGAGLFSCPLGGGSKTKISTGANPNRIATDGAYLYITDWQSCGNPGNGYVSKTPLNGDPGGWYFGGEACPWGIAVDATDVYWVTREGGEVRTTPIASPTPTTVVSGQSKPSGIALDSACLYWTSTGSGQVMKLAK